MRDQTGLTNEVLEKIPNKYMAVIVSSRRARAINDGSPPLVRTPAAKPTTLALQEIAAGLVVPDETRRVEMEEAQEADFLPSSDDESVFEAESVFDFDTDTDTVDEDE